MSDLPEVCGVVIWCDLQGNILGVVRDDLGISGALAPGRPFSLVVDRAALPKALNFLVEVRSNGAAFDWQLNVLVGEQVEVLHFNGAVVGDAIIVVGARTRNGMQALYAEMMRMHNEQTNALRQALKERSELARAQADRDEPLYDEIARLNNELVNLQRELARQNAELARLNAQKNQFLGMAAHDLRSPLAVIQSYSEFLLDEAAPSLSPEHVEFLTVIRASSQFMLQLVNDLLDVSRIESGQLQLDCQPTDLIALVERNVALNRVLAARKDIRLTFEHPPALPPVTLDAAKIEQVLNNLVGNAIKYTYPGTEVTVYLERRADEVLLAVRDRGPGIPEAEQGKLFRPFQTTSVRSTAGEKSTGLGLMIARRIVEGHRGRIWVESQVGVGTTFWVALPLDEATVRDEAVATHPEVATAEPALPAVRILIVDDSEINQKVAVRMLERLQLHADVASNGREALERLRQQPYDLVLIDVNMPEMGGLEATRRLRQQLPAEAQPYVVAMTASASDSDRLECRSAGMDDYVGKPLNLDHLRAVLERYQRWRATS
jgi:signal transduction histidine kinase/CheY-like chemotaxis protein